MNEASLANLQAPWKPGESGNPGGKAKGARDRLQADFLLALANDFAEYGAEAIKQAREKKPDAYIRAIAGLMPKQFEAADPSRVDDDAVLTAIKERLAARAARTMGEPEGGKQ